MKIVLAGGSGQLGRVLRRAFVAEAHSVVVLARSSGADDPGKSPTGDDAAKSHPFGCSPGAPTGEGTVAWDGRTLDDWTRAIDGSDVVVNLAGRSVNCRYSKTHLREMLESRVESTRAVGQAISRSASPPRVWLQMSTATIYAHRFDAPNDEATGIIGGSEPDAPLLWRRSIEIAQAWEGALSEADTPRTRKVALRSAMVMSPDPGGILDVLLGLVRRGLGGTAGSGEQFVSWIHHRDYVNALALLIRRDDIAGAVNLASPNPLPYRDFMKALRDAWGARIGLPATEWMLAIGAWAMRTETELVLKSRRVVPGRLLGAGFAFEYPDWPRAARDLVGAWRARIA